jgi:DNA-binding NarL/FixJ family response regulator
MKDKYLSGWNTYQLAAELNRLGVPTPLQRKLWSGKAKKRVEERGMVPKWCNSTVANVICNPLHAGMVKKQSGELIQGQHFEHRFFEREIHEAIVEAMKERARRFKTCSGGHKTLHLLSGMVYCARCGNPLRISSSGENEKNYRSYKCMNGRKEGLRTCSNVVVRAQWVEEAIVEEIAKLSETPQMQGLLEKEVRDAVGNQNLEMEKQITQLQRKSDQFEAKFERWAEGFMNQTMSEKRFKKINQQMEIDQAEVQSQLDSLLEARENEAGRERHAKQVREQFRNFPKIWENLDNVEKRQLLALLIEEGKLTVDRTGRDILVKIKLHFLPEREKTILYRNFRGIIRTKATPLQKLGPRQMVLLYYAGQGKTRKECAELMGCKPPSIYTIEKTIRRNLGGVSWKEAIDMSRARVEANVAQLPLGKPGRKAKNETNSRPFISPVLMEVLELFAKGATVKEASERLGLPPVTVQGRRSRILKLMGTPSILEAAEKAREWGILTG